MRMPLSTASRVAAFVTRSCDIGEKLNLTPLEFLFVVVAAAASAITAGAYGAEQSPFKDTTIWRSERSCGVNSLYFLLRYNDVNVPYKQISDALLRSDDLPSLADLKQAGLLNGLPAKLGKTTPSNLTEEILPAIVHFDSIGARGEQGGHFSVLLRTDARGVTLVDGTTMQTETMPWPDFKRSWSGYLLWISRPQKLNVHWWQKLLAILVGCLCAVAVDYALHSRAWPFGRRIRSHRIAA